MNSESPPLAFVDLARQYASLAKQIDARIRTVLDHGQFIAGPEVGEFERALGTLIGASHVVSCANGTDALQVALMVKGVGPGDAVFVPSFTYTATAEVILLLGATPVFVEVDASTYNLDASHLADRIETVRREGRLRPRGVIAVDLFGRPADYEAVERVAGLAELFVLADAAQSIGAYLGNRHVGTLAPLTATSFFPAKPLGCYGDGGAMIFADPEEAAVARSICLHGKGEAKYDVARLGVNSRLDTLQAGILLAKLESFEAEIVRRNEVAARYNSGLADLVELPGLPAAGDAYAWAQYTVRVDERDRIQKALAAVGVPSAVYYPRPMHLQAAYRAFGEGEGSLPVSEALCARVLSLPMHGHMHDDEIVRVVDAVKAAVRS